MQVHNHSKLMRVMPDLFIVTHTFSSRIVHFFYNVKETYNVPMSTLQEEHSKNWKCHPCFHKSSICTLPFYDRAGFLQRVKTSLISS